MKKIAIFLAVLILTSTIGTFAEVTVFDEYHKILFSDNFDDADEPPYKGGNYILGAAACELVSEEGRGQAVRFPEKQGKRMYISYGTIDKNYETPTEEGAKVLRNVKYEVDMKLGQGATATIYAITYYDNVSVPMLVFRSGDVHILGENGDVVGEYDNEWHSYKIEVDSVKNSINFYIDGVIVAENKSADKLEKEIRGVISFGPYGRRDVEESKYIYVDNIKMSSKSAEPEITFSEGTKGEVSYCVLPSEKTSERTYLAAVYKKNGEITDIRIDNAVPTTDVQKIYHSFNLDDGGTVDSYKFTISGGKFINTEYKTHTPVTDSDFEELLDAFREYILEGYDNDLQNPDVISGISQITEKGRKAADMMDMSPDATVLFKKVSAITTTDHMSGQFSELMNMAMAFGVKGGELEGDEELKEKILYALDWLYENLYGVDEINGTGWHSTSGYNWYDWYISSPRDLMKTLVIMNEFLSDEQIKQYLVLFDYIRKNMKTGDSLASKISRSFVCTLYATLVKNQKLLETTVSETKDILKIVDSGVGYYADGSYIFHNHHPYAGFYGINLLESRFIPLFKILSGTRFDFGDDIYSDIMTHMRNTYMPTTFKGRMFTTLMGRADGTDDKIQGGKGINVALSIYSVAKEEDKAFLKDYIVRNSGSYEVAKEYVNLNQFKYLTEIFADNPKPLPYQYVRALPHSDRVIWRRGDAAVVISMSSERVYDYESINGGNKKGWYMSDGATYVYSGENHINQYTAKNWWQSADREHMPGTTETIRQRQALSFSTAYLRPVDFVGGLTHNNEYAVAAFDFKAFSNSTEPEDTDYSGYGGDFPVHESDLSAKKSWFLFDNEIVSLGSNIKTTDGYETRTYVSNYRLATDETVKKGENWIRYSKGEGYYFPAEIPTENTYKSGKFHETWISHGTDPSNGKYAYVILPNVTSDAEMSTYSENPDIEILSQNEFVHAVKEKNTGITGYVFWSRGTYSDLTVSAPCVLSISGKEIKTADPTHKLDVLNVTYKGKTYVFDMKARDGETISKALKN